MGNVQKIFTVLIGVMILILGYLILTQTPVPVSDRGVDSSSTPLQTATVAPSGQIQIQVTEPKPGDSIGLPLVIRGRARVFENTFSYRIRDENGNILYESNAMTDARDSGIFGNFALTVSYPAPKGERGTVEVFEYSPKDGTEINKASIPVLFADDIHAMTVKIYLGSRIIDPTGSFCERTYTIDRRIARTSAPARAALEELLKGPDRVESDKGFFTNINSGVSIQKLSISQGIAKVDFSNTIEAGSGGSCRVAAIRSQITNTLRQFSNIQNVIISVDGRVEDALQP